jgi:hypothetical protein
MCSYARTALRYRVRDLRTNGEYAVDVLVTEARSPEDAIRKALGLDVVRSGSSKALVARVFWESIGRTNHSIDLFRSHSEVFRTVCLVRKSKPRA